MPCNPFSSILAQLILKPKSKNLLELFDCSYFSYACIDRVPSFYFQLKTSFSQLMQIWQLFRILKQPAHISVAVFYNLTKLTNYLFIFAIEIQADIQLNKMMRLERKYLMFSPFDISSNLLCTFLNIQPCLILNTQVIYKITLTQASIWTTSGYRVVHMLKTSCAVYLEGGNLNLI